VSGFTFARAVKEQEKARIALAGPSGSGKTYTALTIARAFGGTVAVVDTERRSARKYASLFEFDTMDNLAQFSPEALPDLLAAAAGYTTVVVDSLSHFWSGIGGMLEQVDRLAKRNGGNSFGGWKDARPMERRMIDALLAFPGHVIVTMRTKTEWIVEEDTRGKKVPRKLGLKPEQRDGIEYEFDVVGDLDLDNNLTISKTRCPALQGYVVGKPGAEFAQIVMDWLDDGVAATTVGEFVELAVHLDTYEDALALYSRVQAAGKLGASVTDDEGGVTILGDLIASRGQRLKTEAATAPAEPVQEAMA